MAPESSWWASYTFIDPLSVLQIGMLPAVDPARIVHVGNAAGNGAKEILVSAEQRLAAESLAARIEYLELTVYPRYSRFLRTRCDSGLGVSL